MGNTQRRAQAQRQTHKIPLVCSADFEFSFNFNLKGYQISNPT
jgi:hypothetical protein